MKESTVEDFDKAIAKYATKIVDPTTGLTEYRLIFTKKIDTIIINDQPTVTIVATNEVGATQPPKKLGRPTQLVKIEKAKQPPTKPGRKPKTVKAEPKAEPKAVPGVKPKYTYVTPLGTFATMADAAFAHNITTVLMANKINYKVNRNIPGWSKIPK